MEKHNVNMTSMVLQKRTFLFITTVVFTTMLLISIQNKQYNEESYAPLKIEGFSNEELQKWTNLRTSMKSNMSELSKMLYLNEVPNIVNDNNNKKYQILVWKYGTTIENRHLKQYSDKKVDPFRECSVKNCEITYKETNLETADIVIFHLHRIKGVQDLPKSHNQNQIWAFLTDESPYNTFLGGKSKLKDYNGIFNWSMTYRMDADIPVPYGRTVIKSDKDNTEMQIRKRRDVLVAVMGSNCGGNNHRWNYIRELQKYIKIDVYGSCGTIKTCPGHFTSDCPALEKYMFYLAFENSNCDEYVTEKLWWNAFQKKSIPIVMGAKKETYAKLLPINSYLNVDDFASPRILAEYIYHLNKSGEFENYYQWKKNFVVLNEHGYFKSKSFHYCRICEALNYNKREKKVYENLENFWSVKRDCHPAWDAES